MSWRLAATIGVIFAVLMCVWLRLDRGLGFDELGIRFAVYFAVLTVGLRVIVTWLARGGASRR